MKRLARYKNKPVLIAESAVNSMYHSLIRYPMIQAYADDVYGGQGSPTRKKHDAHTKKGRFGFVPMHGASTILNALDAALFIVRESFDIDMMTHPTAVDAGCGCGNILPLFGIAGFHPVGLELEVSSIKIAKEFLKGSWPSAKVKRVDIIKHDYKPYEVVYFFNPLSDRRLEHLFELQVLKTMRPGAVAIGAFSGSIFNSAMLTAADCVSVKQFGSVRLYVKERELTDKELRDTASRW